ncbi:hypothetical protein ACL9RF_02640 [Sphingobacterium sp. Mn56C]|uniref:hypothetical protein n=1 Tax=Sphingobacterium sp. Mn56C TaxID=3395261 RepID=UPI003BD0C832
MIKISNPRQIPVYGRNCLIIMLLLTLFYGCKKESPSFPYKDLLRFSVNDAQGKPLVAAIHGNAIILYWPPEQKVPESITPELKVSDRAHIFPASLSKVPFVDGTTFTVTAEDGTTQVYTLKKVVNQPKPYVKDEGNTYGLHQKNGKFYSVVSEEIRFFGDYFNPEDGQLKVFLQTADGKEVEAPIDTEAFHQNLVRFKAIPGDNAVGHFTGIRIFSSPYSIAIKQEFDILADPRPQQLPFTGNINAKIGEELILPGKNMDKTTGIRIWNKELGGYYDVEILEKQPNSLKIKIPTKNFPEGIYTAAFYNFEAKPDYPEFINTFPSIYRPFNGEIKIQK